MTDEEAMAVAIEEARAALEHEDVPVGAVVIIDGKIVARRHNEREKSQDPTAHAEILALRDAAACVGSWRLNEATLIVTLEPCIMCAGAAVSARLGHLVYGAADPKAGATNSLYSVCNDPRLNHDVPVRSGVLADECSEMLKAFFRAKRKPPTEL